MKELNYAPTHRGTKEDFGLEVKEPTDVHTCSHIARHGRLERGGGLRRQGSVEPLLRV